MSRLRAHATARYIAAASPETVAALLAELHEANEANEAFGRRQAWWNERMFALEQERDALAAECERLRHACIAQAERSEAAMLKARTQKARDVYSAAAQTAHMILAAADAARKEADRG